MNDVPTSAIRGTIRDLVAYPIEHERVQVKLDANELGFELPTEILEAFRSISDRVDLRRYPEGHADSLVAALSRAWRADPATVLAGNGSNEMISLIFSAFGGNPGGADAPVVVIPTPSFGVYPIQARSHGFAVRAVPLGDDFSLSAEAVLAAARGSNARAVILASPNNPTGNSLARDAIEEILHRFEGPVVVDEAYQPFSRDSWLGEWERWPNLLVLRTLSKVGLAALRVGFLFADPRLTAELRKAKLPFNLNSISAALATVAFEEWHRFEAVARAVVLERERLAERLARLAGLRVFPSDANFLLIRVPGNADTVWSRLLAKGISVRNFSNKPGLTGCLRVTVGKPDENDQLVAGLRDVLAK